MGPAHSCTIYKRMKTQNKALGVEQGVALGGIVAGVVTSKW